MSIDEVDVSAYHKVKLTISARYKTAFLQRRDHVANIKVGELLKLQYEYPNLMIND